jgi:hypothetical protein
MPSSFNSTEISGIGGAPEGILAVAFQGVAYQFPVDQVFATVDGQARMPFEGGVGDIKPVPHPDNAGIGMEAGKDWVVKNAFTGGAHGHAWLGKHS